ncbi:lipoprotein [Spiroplasma endosymbiont of Cantharis lateralis]|uniref:lipoprotein n=1 Tax=Spiroplasma endosymbiont of Cantharis lateralis TaxID=3066277 RepID=UPI00313BCE36
MRKILSILATTSLVASASVAVVSCNTIQNSDFKLPKFPTNVDEAKKIILDLSKKQAVTEFKTAEMYEEGKDDSEIENFEIESRFEEYYTIILVAAHKIVKLESEDTVISVWEYNEDNVLVETEMVLWKYASVSDFYDEN